MENGGTGDWLAAMSGVVCQNNIIIVMKNRHFFTWTPLNSQNVDLLLKQNLDLPSKEDVKVSGNLQVLL
jgi:hypothetical protein